MKPRPRWRRQRAREGIELDVSTLADRVGACVVALDPIIQALWAHVLSTGRIHADDRTVPVLAKMKTVTGRIWNYVRDDRPFGGKDPPAAVFRYSRTRISPGAYHHHARYRDGRVPNKRLLPTLCVHLARPTWDIMRHALASA